MKPTHSVATIPSSSRMRGSSITRVGADKSHAAADAALRWILAFARMTAYSTLAEGIVL